MPQFDDIPEEGSIILDFGTSAANSALLMRAFSEADDI